MTRRRVPTPRRRTRNIESFIPAVATEQRFENKQEEQSAVKRYDCFLAEQLRTCLQFTALGT